MSLHLPRQANAWLIAVPVGVIVAAGMPALATCLSTSSAQDLSSNGSATMQAVTTQSGCVNRTVYVRAYLENFSFTCLSGSSSPSGCINHNSSGNTSVTLNHLVCGYVQGQSRHHYIDPGGTVNLPNRSPVLYAGDCAEIECANQGPDYYWNGFECVYAPGSPIVIATAGSAQYKFTSAANGVQFDIDGDGAAEQIAWTEPDSDVAFLALDRDGDGLITSGRELFGNYTLPGVADGFTALARTNMESNGGQPRASVSADDPLFARLLLWTDRNHNGVSEPSELRPASAILSDIGLGFERHHRRDGFGNELRYRGWVHIRTARGRNRAEELPEQQARKRFVFDVFFQIER
jgi:hypothetical protein